MMRLAALILLTLSSTAFGATPKQAAVASAHPLATAAGVEILDAGGNAFDAAVAVSAALGVVEPYGSGLGGGGFYLLRRAEDDLEVVVDGRETAPGAATRDMYLDADGEPRRGASLMGPLAAGVPGVPKALEHLSLRYGKLPLARSLAPAIRYAEEGFPAHQRMVLSLSFTRRVFGSSEEARAIFFPGGEPPKVGSLFRQPDLAETLRAIAAKGSAGFYEGEIAERMVAGVQASGGIWTLDDLANYGVKERAPLVAHYRGGRLLTAPPPSSGGVAIINMMNMLNKFALDELDPVERHHVMVEVMRRAFRDRAEFLGDPDFFPVPVERLTHPFYASGQVMSMRMDRATPSAGLPGVEGSAASGGSQTTHFSVLDSEGNAVAGTQSLNTYFGAGFVPPGTGVLLNNEMDDFSIKQGVPNAYQLVGGQANEIAPGKRMLSSMTPTIMTSDRGMVILGTPGGSRIISMVLLGALAWLDGADAKAIVTNPRFHHQYLPDRITYEKGALPESVVTGLEALGHELSEARRTYGNMQVITWNYENGVVEAASDPRAAGGARIY